MTRIKLALDDGHGDNGVTPGKRTPKFSDGSFMYENAFNKVVVKYLDKHLNRCGFDTILVAPTDADTPLATRVNTANKAKVDAYISIHANAASGNWGSPEGVETFVGASSFSKKLANNVHNQLIKGTSQKNRGVKDGTHLYVIRNTIAPAILVECAFMDNEREARLLLSDSFRRECALEIAKGICESFGVKFIEEQEVKGVSTSKEETKVPQELLNETGRFAARELIKKGVKEGVFTSKHEKVNEYQDKELISYGFAYVNRKFDFEDKK